MGRLLSMRTFLLMLAFLLIGLAGCGDGDPAEDSGKPVVFVSIPPQAYFAERIAEGHVDIEVLVGPGENPHVYNPGPKQMVRLSNARALLTLGLPFEQQLLRKLSADTDLKIIDTRSNIALDEQHDPPPHDHAADHDHEHNGHDHHAHDEHGHDHGEIDLHLWMSPPLASELAENICQALIEIDPDHAEAYRANLADLQADLQALDDELAEALLPLKGKTFYVYHPAFGYFARRYGLVQQAVETGGKSPGPRHVKELVEQARANNVRVIFVQPQFSQQAAETIARQINGTAVAVDPLAKDYLANLRNIAEKLQQALTPQVSPQ